MSEWERRVAGVIQHLTELCVDEGDTEAAIETAQRGVHLIPTHGGVTEALMRAHAADGDLHSVHRVYETHCRALDNLGLDEPAESTVELYDTLRRRSGHHA
ncbi:MAG: bacterial transcriptional activator domain-containing protein [Acidimicrobiales bacterium]